MADTRTHARADARATDEGGGLATQAAALFLAPAAFFAHLQIGYALVPWSCVQRTNLWIHVSGVAAVVLALLGALIAWRLWERTGGTSDVSEAGAVPRARFVGLVGIGLSALLALILAAQWIAAFFISPCQ